MTSQPDRMTAVLGKMRQRAVLAADVSQDTALRVGAAVNLACEDVPRLLAGYEALLTQAARWDEESAALYARAEDFHDVRGGRLMVRAEATAEKAAELRDVIAASLLGKDGA